MLGGACEREGWCPKFVEGILKEKRRNLKEML